MTIEIRREIVAFKDAAKVQQIGLDKNGNPRYMIYITQIIKKTGWKKGDKLVVELYKLDENSQVIRNHSTVMEQQKKEREQVADPVTHMLNEEEHKFKQSYQKEQNPAIKDFLLKTAEKQFGETRLQVILSE